MDNLIDSDVMNLKKICFLTLSLFAITSDGADITRVYRPVRYSRGNTNLIPVQHVDDASWIWATTNRPVMHQFDDWSTYTMAEGSSDVEFLKFRKEFDVKEGEGELIFDVSGDERFYLTLDGVFVARGPNRGPVENWQYQTYSVKNLKPGRHVFEAVVWKVGIHSPMAQVSHRGGFVFSAEGVYDAKLTTGKTTWKVAEIDNVKALKIPNEAWEVGGQFEVKGRGPYAVEPKAWRDAVVVRNHAGMKGRGICGVRTVGWMLFPTQLPDQTEERIPVGAVRAVARNVEWRSRHTYSEEDCRDPLVGKINDFLKNGGKLVIPANTRFQAAVDLGVYKCAYPILKMKGAKGARVSWTWVESAIDAKTKRKANRNEIIGKYLRGYGDDFISDGAIGEFSTPWFRCGRWCRIDVETLDEPLEISEMYLISSRYPLEMESAFSATPDAAFGEIREICARAMQMCAHETLFDCPYYEQLMYAGDTRVQLLVLAAMSNDERLIKRAIECYDLASRDDGTVPMSWPQRGIQESFTYTLAYLLMYGDYVMNGTDRQWLKARLSGFRKTMSGVEYYENKEGLLEDVPGWPFMDWPVGWHGGMAPGSFVGDGVNAEINLFWLLALESAVKVEKALGNDDIAEHWAKKATKLKSKIFEKFWCVKRELLSDTPQMKHFSEHAQALGIISGVLEGKNAELALKHLLEDKDLARCTVYFSYYLFEAFFKMDRGDLFLKRLDLWRDYLKLGVTTLLERPENEKIQARSDCHAWGAHPIWFMQTGLAGIKSDGEFFSRVLIKPSPGSLKRIKASHPHPKGMITVDLEFLGDGVSGYVDTPVEGCFKYKNTTLTLKAGINRF